MSPTYAAAAFALSALVLALVWLMAADPMYPQIVGYAASCIVALFWAAAIVTAQPVPQPDAPAVLTSYSSTEVQP